MRIDDLLRRSAKLRPEAVAVDDGREVWTHARLARSAESLGAGLTRAGVEPGDRVAVLAKNRAEYVALYFACARIGAVIVPMNWRLRAAEARGILEDCEPRAIVAEAELAGVLAGACPGAERFAIGVADGWLPFDDLRRGDAAPTRAPAGAGTVAIQMYTSGTTGRPKGAMLTHGNVVSLTGAWLLDMRLEPERSRFLQVTPLFHVGGMLMVMSSAMAGATLLLLPEFDPVAVIEGLATRGVTHTLLVPAMIQWMLLEPALAGRSFPDLELIAYGASPMPVAVLERAIEVFGCDFLQGYGLTETAGVLLTLTPEDHRFEPGTPPPRRLGAAGREVACSEVRVVDAEGNDVDPGAVGEIVARGDNVTPGYWRNPEATAEAIVDGWFHTGDLATVDEEGYVYVVDRLKDMILVGGENVYPREVEEVLMTHPAVAETAVVGAPHDVFGEEVVAVVVPRADAAADPRGLIRHCRERLARYKCPTRVELAERLPRNAAGKLDKRALRAPFWEGRERLV